MTDSKEDREGWTARMGDVPVNLCWRTTATSILPETCLKENHKNLNDFNDLQVTDSTRVFVLDFYPKDMRY